MVNSFEHTMRVLNLKTGGTEMMDFERMDEVLDRLDDAAEKLFTGPFEADELMGFLAAAVDVGREVVPNLDHENGKALLLGVWRHYDEAYNLVEAIDRAVDFKKMIPVAGHVIEAWDDNAIRSLIELLVIPALAAAVFRKPDLEHAA